MVKYIVKRLLLALLILFCVSIILYTLVRVMPVNFVETQYYTTHANTDVSDAELQQAMLDANLEDIEKAQEQGYSALWNKVFGYDGLSEKEMSQLENRLSNDWSSVSEKFESDYSEYAFSEVWEAFYFKEGYIGILTKYVEVEDDNGETKTEFVNIKDENGKYVTDLHVKKTDAKGDYILDEDENYIYVVDTYHSSSYASAIYKACADENKIAEYMSANNCDRESAIELIKKDTAIGIIFDRDNVKTYSKATVAVRSIVAGYVNWAVNFIKGDMGTSFKYNRPVQEVIVSNMGISFIVSLISLILQLIIAIPLGIQSAYHQYGKLDYITTIFTMIGISFPSFFFGSLLIKWFAVDLRWFPVSGLEYTNSTLPVFIDRAYHLVLPIAVLTILSVGSLMRYMRTNTLEVLNADYIRTARAKGASENSVVYKHVFRNTLIPLVTTLAGILPGLFGGAMITETIFDLPGIGNIAYQALQAGDVPFIMAYNMFMALLTVIGVLLTDVMYAVVDPRVKLGD